MHLNTNIGIQFAAVVVVLITLCRGHGRLLEPPSRSSMWRLGYGTAKNYQDNQLFCGGTYVEYILNQGKCGVCGDPWQGPRENEAGGKYAKGIIVRQYKMGHVMHVTVEITANHKGYFEFHICPKDDPHGHITDDCMKQHPLAVADTGIYKHYIGTQQGKIKVKVQLPHKMRCRACVFRWTYTAANSWGTDPNGTSCVGCGNQEQFVGCSDIAVGHEDVELGVPAPGTAAPFPKPGASTPAASDGRGHMAASTVPFYFLVSIFTYFGFYDLLF